MFSKKHTVSTCLYQWIFVIWHFSLNYFKRATHILSKKQKKMLDSLVPRYNFWKTTMPKCPRKFLASLYIFTCFTIYSLVVKPLNTNSEHLHDVGHSSNIYSKRSHKGRYSVGWMSRNGLRQLYFILPILLTGSSKRLLSLGLWALTKLSYRLEGWYTWAWLNCTLILTDSSKISEEGLYKSTALFMDCVPL